MYSDTTWRQENKTHKQVNTCNLGMFICIKHYSIFIPRNSLLFPVGKIGTFRNIMWATLFGPVICERSFGMQKKLSKFDI